TLSCRVRQTLLTRYAALVTLYSSTPRSPPMESHTEFRRRALIYAGIALVVVFILWNIPQLSLLLFPFRLFVTFVHEAGHGLAAILTGGRFLSFTILPNGAGFATTAGGSAALILSAGY